MTRIRKWGGAPTALAAIIVAALAMVFSSSSSSSSSISLYSHAPAAAWTWYVRQLELRPLWTKSLSSGVVGGLGDALAQTLELQWGVRQGRNWRRSATIAAEGLLVSGPFLHVAYDWMDANLDLKQYVSVDENKSQNDGTDADSNGKNWALSAAHWAGCGLQVLVDLILVDSFLVGTLMATSGILQGRSRAALVREFRFDYLPAVRISWLSSLGLAPLQMVNFSFCPLALRVLITNLEDIVWNAAVSYMAHKSRPQ